MRYGPRFNAVARFQKFVEKTTTCWNWTGALTTDGYGSFHLRNRDVRAHRASYEMAVGKIPDGMTLDHLCRNRRCVNPAHLEPVPHKENVLRGEGITAKQHRQTHCKNGHEFTFYNTILKGASRRCRACTNANARAARKKQAAIKDFEKLYGKGDKQ